MNKNYGLFGAAIQTARGTAASAPTVAWYASSDSDGIDSSKSLETLNLTIGGKSTAVDTYADEIGATMDTTTIGFADVVGFMLAAAMGADTATADDGVYTHAITAGTGALPYVTAFEQKGATNAAIRKITDAKVDQVTMTAEGVAPIAFQYQLAGCDAPWTAATAWTGAACDPTDGYYTLAGADVKFSLSTGTPGALPAGVVLSSLEIGVNNNCEATRVLGDPKPKDQTETTQQVSVNITGTTDSTALYREVITGSSTGTAIATAVVTGSLEMTFQHSVESDYSFKIEVPAIPWECTVPAVSTDGGAFDLSLSTDAALIDNGTPIAFTVINGSAGYLS